MSIFASITTGAAAYVTIAWVAVHTVIPQIEADLIERSEVIVTSDELRWVTVDAREQSLTLNGLVPSYNDARAAVQMAANMWGVTQVEDRMTVVGTTGACQQEIDTILGQEAIQFKSSSAKLRTSNKFLLHMLTVVAVNCRTAIEISGHTNSQGNPASNMALSQRRADAVRTHLVSSGVPTDRLIAKGYGETHPIYDNASEEGRRHNQRIEFHVTGSRSS